MGDADASPVFLAKRGKKEYNIQNALHIRARAG